MVDSYMDTTRKVLLVSGSLRAGSTNSALLRIAAHVAPTGVEAVLFDGVARLPYFDPDQDSEPLHPAVEALRAAIGGCDAILFSTPEYAGALPGAFKNLLEWAVGDADASSIYEKPVGWVNVSASPTGAADAYRSLAIVLGYVHAAVVDEACVQIPVTRQMVGCDGLIADPGSPQRRHRRPRCACLVSTRRMSGIRRMSHLRLRRSVAIIGHLVRSSRSLPRVAMCDCWEHLSTWFGAPVLAALARQSAARRPTALSSGS